jgi:hypothetical protein
MDKPPLGNTTKKLVQREPGRPMIELTNNYSFFNTLWYVTSTLLKGGCDFGPRAISTRLLGGVWWVFTLIITSYTCATLKHGFSKQVQPQSYPVPPLRLPATA